MLTSRRKCPQVPRGGADGLVVGQRNTVVTDMHTLVEEGAWERFSRGVLLTLLPLSLVAFVAI
jgi:hypothetical protein